MLFDNVKAYSFIPGLKPSFSAFAEKEGFKPGMKE